MDLLSTCTVDKPQIWMPNYTEPNFNREIERILKSHGVDYHFMPCALGRPIVSSQWTIHLPDIPEERWRRKNFRLVIHAQDFVHFYMNQLCVELHWLEEQLTPEQQKKVIFVHWDHSLRDIYQGNIKLVEFASHSYELVHQLKSRYEEWKPVNDKSDFKYNWLCLNGRAREYRQEVYNMLRHEPSGFVSHSIFNPVESHPYQSYNFNNVDNFVALRRIYRQSRSSIITESMYNDAGGIITEKTLLAIAAKHPFMCIGHRGIHREIQERGFQLYDDLFDLSYDNEPKERRMYQAIEKNLPILREPIDRDRYRDKIESNYEWLFGGYAQSIVDRAEKQLREILEKKF